MNQKEECRAAEFRGKVKTAEWLSDNELRLTLQLDEASVRALKKKGSLTLRGWCKPLRQ